jgi:hypothetical protein
MFVPERLYIGAHAYVGEIFLSSSFFLLSVFLLYTTQLANGSRLWVIVASPSNRVKANERQKKRKTTATTTERACSFVTHQFVFHIVSHHSPHNMNNMVDYSDLFDKFHDYIEN